ncbi:hypothetical protein [Amaricoccus tamworthensis]|uniref:hypothetical protein n=1 Tax=Amaricoccus tamworthensis TaxID=57002 RepID=UPI003C7C62A7
MKQVIIATIVFVLVTTGLWFYEDSIHPGPVRSTPKPSTRITYDPDSCATPTDGRVFVRLMNGQAFAFPAYDFIFFRGRPGWPDEEFADPSEPEGCPLHPIVSQGVVVTYRATAPLGSDAQVNTEWHPRVLQLISNPGGGGPVVIQDSDLKFFRRYCGEPSGNRRHGAEDEPATQRGVLVNVSPVLLDCRLKDPNLPDQSDWTSFLVARPGMHPEYEGRRYAVLCFGAFHPGGSRDCQSRYNIEGDLGVVIKFSDAVVPPEDMATFDLQIRAWIQSQRTPEYDVPAREPLE